MYMYTLEIYFYLFNCAFVTMIENMHHKELVADVKHILDLMELRHKETNTHFETLGFTVHSLLK